MEFNLTTNPPHRQRGDCVMVAAFGVRRLSPSAQRLDQASSKRLSQLLRSSGYAAKPGQVLMLNNVRGAAATHVLVVGCGKSSPVSESDYRRALRGAMEALNAAGVRAATSYLGEVRVAERDAYWSSRQTVEAGHDAAYRFDRCKSEAARDAARSLRRISLAVGEAQRDAFAAGMRDGAAIGQGVQLAKDLGNLPANICTPTYLAEQATRLAARHATVSVKVRGESDMKRLKMGSLLSVARGSREPACLIALEHAGAKRSQRPTVLVGKGVTFDSGGISIKPAAAMDEMKYDMCGAGAVLGTMEAVAELALPHNVVGIVPATENLPDGSASKPGDIVTSMAGQTVEILNTDAEGRLILCDALTFAGRYNPDAVVDIATLTGACVIALGSHASGLFSNDGELAQSLLQAGEYGADRAWQMPLWDEYGEALKSNFADVANVGGREAGAITAAAFLSRFTKAYRWAHLDVAGTAWRSGRRKGATGRPVRLLTQYLLNRVADQS